MGYTVISSTPSPYARKVRINLLEQGVPFELRTEVPWDRATETPRYNPLEKLPILIETAEDSSSGGGGGGSGGGDGDAPRPKKVVYESRVILDYLNTVAFPARSLLPAEAEARVDAKQIEALADGVCDALVISNFERRRPEDKQSREWDDRQKRKIEGGLKALDEIVREQARDGFIIGGKLSIADLSVGSLLGFMNLRRPDHHWKKSYPALEKYWQNLEERDSFKQTVPKMFKITDPVV